MSVVTLMALLLATGVELTQYTEPAGGRYVTPPAASAAGYDPYTQVPPTNAVTSAAAGGTWNPDVAADNALRGSVPPTTGARGWNGGVPGVADATAARGPLQRMGDNIQDGIQGVTEPLRDGIDRIDDRVRTATENLGSRTQDMIDQLRPNGGLFGGRADSGAAATVPPATAATAASGWNGGASTAPVSGGLATSPADAGATATAPPTGGWNGGTSPAPSAPTGPAPGATDQPPGSWNQQAPPASDPGIGFASAPTDGPIAPPLTNGGSSFPRGSDSDPWANAADPRLRGDAPTGAGAAGSTAAAGATAPPAFPGASVPPAFGGATGPLLGAASGSSPTGAAGPTPAITGGMLAQDAARPLDGFDATTIPFTPIGSTMGTSPGITPLGGLGGTPTAASTANAQNLGTSLVNATNQQAAAAQEASGSEARNRAAVILAWVLLSGSIAGNMYLFWSYLDVRTKYRSLVRKTARAVGSRFSAA